MSQNERKGLSLESVGLIRAMLDEIVDLTDGEACDHSVNICWCGTFDLIERAREFLDAQETRGGEK